VQVTVKLIASLQAGRLKEEQIDFPVNTTISQLVQQLAIPQDEVGMILVNGKASFLDTVVQTGDTISLFPLVGGG